MNYPAAPLPHSGLGIVSTLIAVVAGLGMLGAFVYAGMLGMEAGGQPSETDPRVMAVGLAITACGALLLLGGLLGVAGLFVGERRRLFAWIGTILCGLPLLLAIALMVLGLAMAP
jgi:membrane glycosyltransferase